MNRILSIIAATALAGLIGCSNSLDPVDPAMLADGQPVSLGVPTDEELIVPLVARHGRVVGSVTVSNDDTNLYMTISADEGWLLYRTRVAVSTRLGRFPSPGQQHPHGAAFMTRHNGIVDYTYEIPLWDGWLENNQELYLSVRALVRELVGGRPRGGALAWAEGAPYFGRAWFAYFTYTVQASAPGGNCALALELPNGGEVLCLSQFAEIIWEAEGNDCGAYVRLELLHDGMPCVLIAEEAPNDGFYFWDEVQRCGDEFDGYTIRVTDLESGSSDESDATFVIDTCPE